MPGATEDFQPKEQAAAFDAPLDRVYGDPPLVISAKVGINYGFPLGASSISPKPFPHSLIWKG
jgi:hypothetical protein